MYGYCVFHQKVYGPVLPQNDWGIFVCLQRGMLAFMRAVL